ncbi:hypothetical protein IT400_02550 [Candidatus Nomurabacteria bacterium]|nr:hypothetical protein [Candidatus Nomurabacteria bacterium]
MALLKKRKKITTKKIVKVIKKSTQKITSKKVIKKTLPKKVKVAIKKKIISKPKSKSIIRTKTKLKKIITKKTKLKPSLTRSGKNPILKPNENNSWESQSVINPGVIVIDGKVHLFYRALGNDGVSRIGYAVSDDGINFDDRLMYPVYVSPNFEETSSRSQFTSPARKIFDPKLYTSGGGWGGCEDPRAVLIDGRVYLTLNMFNGWHSMRVAIVSIAEDDLLNMKWRWSDLIYLSKPGDRQKNWVLFPEKINGKFALFHNLDMGDPFKVHIAYLDHLDMSQTPSGGDAPDPQGLPDHEVAWHNRTRSIASPPIRTKYGWLVLYHAMSKNDHGKYKVGAMILDLKDPTHVLYRSIGPILEPDEWYENDYKPGIVYASGAVVKDGTLFVYYGGGDKYIAVAQAPLESFLQELMNQKVPKLSLSKSKL